METGKDLRNRWKQAGARSRMLVKGMVVIAMVAVFPVSSLGAGRAEACHIQYGRCVITCGTGNCGRPRPKFPSGQGVIFSIEDGRLVLNVPGVPGGRNALRSTKIVRPAGDVHNTGDDVEAGLNTPGESADPANSEERVDDVEKRANEHRTPRRVSPVPDSTEAETDRSAAEPEASNDDIEGTADRSSDSDSDSGGQSAETSEPDRQSDSSDPSEDSGSDQSNDSGSGGQSAETSEPDRQNDSSESSEDSGSDESEDPGSDSDRSG